MFAFALCCACWAVPEPEPPLRDLDRFPGWVARDNVAFADLHIAWLEAQVASGCQKAHEPELTEWLWQARLARDTWRLLAAARDADHAEDVRRDYLRDLRARIGLENYSLGRMPYPVPLVHFARR